MSSEQVNQASIPEATVANSLIKDQPSVEARKAINQDMEMDTASSGLDSALPAPATSQDASTSTYTVRTALFDAAPAQTIGLQNGKVPALTLNEIPFQAAPQNPADPPEGNSGRHGSKNNLARGLYQGVGGTVSVSP